MSFYDKFEKIEPHLLGVRLPSFNIEAKYRDRVGSTPEDDNATFLRKLCEHGLKSRGLLEKKEYAERLKYELSIIDELSFTDYIVLVWDVINFCREHGIPTGAGRGSAAGSLALFACGVTFIDPVKYGLYFERFISKARAKKKVVNGITYLDGSLAPDVDLDICYYRRKEVLDYLDSKFLGKTAKILTINTLSGKLLIKECGKIVANKKESEVNEVSGWIEKKFGNVEDIESTYTENEKFKAWCDENPMVYEVALKLRDLNKNKSSHPSGIALAYDEIEKSCPLERTTKDEIVTSFDMNWVSLSNIKLDILGLRGVSVVDDACKAIGIKYTDIDFEDVEIYQNLQDLKYPHGLFQIEADCNYGVLRKVKPKNPEELSAVLALGRPGSLAFVDPYSKFTNFQQMDLPDVESLDLKEILSKTGGCILYQETLMQIANRVFKLSLEQAELIRRAVGKKKKEEIAKFEILIKEKGEELGIPKSAQFYWDVLLASADYSFNKCAYEREKVELENGLSIELRGVKAGDKIKAFNTFSKTDHYVKVLDVMHNEKDVSEIVLEDGKSIRTSLEHKFLCEDLQMRPLADVLTFGHFIYTDSHEPQKVTSSRYFGKVKTIDLEVNHSDHNFYANGIVVSNSHAVSYGYLAAITIYLKHKHPQQFFLSLLKMTKFEPNSTEEITKIQKELPHFGINLLPPSLMKSQKDFSLEGDDIRFGLLSVKGISEKTIDNLSKFRRDHQNKFEVFSSAEESGVNLGVLSALIQAGALEGFKQSRTKVVYEAQLWSVLTDREKPIVCQHGQQFDYDLVATIKSLSQKLDEKGKPIIKPSRIETIRKKMDKYRQIYELNRKSEKFANWFYEQKLLGYTAGKHIRDIFNEEKDLKLLSIEKIQSFPEDTKVKFVGRVLEDATKRKSKAGNDYANFFVFDETSQTNVKIFSKSFEDSLELNNGALPKENDIVIIEGKKKEGCVFAYLYAIQSNKIYTKLSELKGE